MDLDRERLIRLLGMTDSDQDAEALVAIRKSNEMLKAHGKSWSDVLGGPSTLEAYKPYEPEVLPKNNEDWSLEPRPGYEPSAQIRDTIRREFPIKDTKGSHVAVMEAPEDDDHGGTDIVEEKFD